VSSKKGVVTKAIEDIMEASRLTDLRRQAQINNQHTLINRLMEGGGTYDDVLQRLNEQIAELTVSLSEAEAEISRLQAEKSEA
jgi:hypothetical protein